MSVLDETFANLLAPSSSSEIKTVLMHLMASARLGHLCVPIGDTLLPDELVEKNPGDLPLKPLVLHRNQLYLQRNWVLESLIVRHFLRLTGVPSLEKMQINFSSELSSEQREAVRHALLRPLTIISGGPGTGKTFTAAKIIEALKPAVVKIAAPTGKAADKLLQTLVKQAGVHVEASTLHRLLGLRPGHPRHFEPKMIRADLIIVDEASMIDAALFAHLLAAVPSGTKLVLLGDPDQLPPI